MRKPSVRSFLAISILLFVVVVSCGTDEAVRNATGEDVGFGSPPLDPTDATLDEILERARVAMGDVTSYRSKYDLVFEGSDLEVAQVSQVITEWQFPGEIRIVATGTDENGVPFNNETIMFPTESYSREGDAVWKQTVYPPEQQAKSVPQSEFPMLEVLDREGMELVSSTEVTGSGVPVYRLEATFVQPQNSFGPAPDEGNYHFITESHVTLFIDHKTLLFVEVRIESRTTENLEYLSSPDSVEPGVTVLDPEISSPAGSGSVDAGPYWGLFNVTMHSFEYNVPVTIVAPDEYEPWDSRVTYSVSVPARQDPQVDYTPTAIPAPGCSEPDTVWPGCEVRTTADLEAVLAVYPDDYKIAVAEDVVVTFSYDRPSGIEWETDGYVWHLPTASFLRVCITDAAKPEIHFRSARSTETHTEESNGLVTMRLNEVLADEAVHDLITSREFDVVGRCD